MNTQSRITGSGYTSLVFQGRALIFLQDFQDQSPRPVSDSKDIQPLDWEHPAEIVLPKAMKSGTLTFSLTEMWDKKAWERLPGFSGAKTLLDVFKVQNSLGAITAQKIIRSSTGVTRTRVYHNLTIVDVDDNETITIGGLDVARKITCKYTHATE